MLVGSEGFISMLVPYYTINDLLLVIHASMIKVFSLVD
jgi:hypothetical protein